MPNIEVNKEGIKISYIRYLSDSGPGFIMLLTILAVYILDPYANNVFYNLKQNLKLCDEIKIFIGVLAFLIATPLGLLLDAIAWVFLGG